MTPTAPMPETSSLFQPLSCQAIASASDAGTPFCVGDRGDVARRHQLLESGSGAPASHCSESRSACTRRLGLGDASVWVDARWSASGSVVGSRALGRVVVGVVVRALRDLVAAAPTAAFSPGLWRDQQDLPGDQLGLRRDPVGLRRSPRCSDRRPRQLRSGSRHAAPRGGNRRRRTRARQHITSTARSGTRTRMRPVLRSARPRMKALQNSHPFWSRALRREEFGRPSSKPCGAARGGPPFRPTRQPPGRCREARARRSRPCKAPRQRRRERAGAGAPRRDSPAHTRREVVRAVARLTEPVEHAPHCQVIGTSSTSISKKPASSSSSVSLPGADSANMPGRPEAVAASARARPAPHPGSSPTGSPRARPRPPAPVGRPA